MNNFESAEKAFTDEQKAKLLKNIQSDLPPAWVVQFSKKHVNRVYFFNKNDGTRTWEHPGLAQGSSSSSQSGSNERKRKSDGKKPVAFAPSSDKKVQKTPEDPKHIKATPVKDSANKSTFTDFVSPQTAPSAKAYVLAPHDVTPTKTPKRKRKKSRGKKAREKISPYSTSKAADERHKHDTPTESDRRKAALSEAAKIEGFSTPTARPVSTNNIANIVKKQVSQISSIEDIEMTEIDIRPQKKEIPIRQQKDDIATTEDAEAVSSKSYSCVIDTNVLLHKHSLDFMETFIEERKREGTAAKNLTFIIPWVVLQELDHLKKDKSTARRAISFLNTQFQSNHSVIKGQSIFEAATVIDGFTIENNDDRILQCCFLMKQSTDGNIPVLITKDINLANKSLANRIKYFEDVADIKKIIGGTKTDLTPSKISELLSSKIEQCLDANKNIISTKRTVPTASNASSSTETRQSSDAARKAEAIYVKGYGLALSALSFVLKKEMKDAFGELWLDIVLRKPPWNMKDVLQCIQKHWLAVFKVLGVQYIVQSHASGLKTLENNKKPDNVEFVKEWLGTALILICGINDKGKYQEPVKSNIAGLQKLQNSLMDLTLPLEDPTTSTSDDVEVATKTDVTSTQDNPVEMIMEEGKSVDFWTALDKIWTSIISHCGMIFQSLSFVPSRISSSPELCQALSSKFESIPPKPLAAHALPFVKDLVESLQASLEKFTSISVPDMDFGPVFIDLVQTLWTTIQAFCVDCDIRSLINSHQEICNGILSSQEMLQRLKMGQHQLEVVKDLLSECLALTGAV